MDSSATALQRIPGDRAFRYRTVRRLVPYAVRHMTRKPFRSSPQARRATAGLQSAEFRRSAHDIYCDMLLTGYQRATCAPVARSTGLALVLFMVFIFTFDQEFERAGQLGRPPDYPDLIDLPRVAPIWSALREYLRAFGREDDVLQYLLATFARHYDDYRTGVIEARGLGDFGRTMRLVERDSGLTLQSIYEIIRLFNGHRQDPEISRQFFAIGIAGKFLDDIRDMADDVAAGDPNLLYALTTANEREHAVLGTALRAGTPVTISWWARHCPVTLDAFFVHTFRYYDQVTDPELRLPLDICLTLLHSRRYWRKPIRRRPEARQ
jgi:hypothetical protein